MPPIHRINGRNIPVPPPISEQPTLNRPAPIAEVPGNTFSNVDSSHTTTRTSLVGGVEGVRSPEGVAPTGGTSALRARINNVSLNNTTRHANTQDPVQDVYQQLLGRAPDQAGKQYWDGQVAELRAQGKSNQEIGGILSQKFRASPEYQTRETVKQAYRDVLGREADADGLRYWTDQSMKVRESANTSQPSITGSQLPPMDLQQGLRDPNAMLTVAVGNAEGNRTPSGGFTGHYQGHTDPGNGAANMGSFSYQVHQGGASTPEQADRVWLNKMRTELPAYEDAARQAGMDPSNPMAASMFFDTYTQAPAAAVAKGGLRDRMGNIADALNTKTGPALLKDLVKERVNSYVNPDTGRLEAGGFGNSPQRLARDQARRTLALAKVVDPQNKLGLHGLDPSSIASDITAGDWKTQARANAATQAPTSSPTDPNAAVSDFVTQKFKQSDEYKQLLEARPTPEPSSGHSTLPPAPSMEDIALGEVMQRGQAGPGVAQMQERLTALGFGVQATGEFGPTTEQVLKDFQKANNVVQNGKLGPTTLQALQKAEQAERPDFSALQGMVQRGKVFGQGDEGAAIYDLQRKLSQSGFPVQDDGTFGPQTAAAVKDFQKANNIVQNGLIGPTTLDKLMASGGGTLANGVLDVPFFKQTDNYTMPDRTCNSSACAMAAKYLGANLSGDDQYLRTVLRYGDTTDHSAQTRALNDYGIKSQFHYNLDYKDIDNALAQGKPVVIGINHRGPRHAPTGGHMITVIGKDGDDYIVNDPYGSLNDGYTGSVNNGKQARYSKAELDARWLVEGPGSGWGRIFE